MNDSLNPLQALALSASAQQQVFEQLLQAISTEKQRLSEWQALAELHQQDVRGKYLPLRRRYAEQQALLLQVIDEHAHRERFSPQQAEKLNQLMRLLCTQVLAVIQNRHVEQLQQRHLFEPTRLTPTRPQQPQPKEFDWDTGASFEHQQQAADEQRAAHKRAAKQQAKHAREHAIDVKSTQSIRAVYRELVGALHPDREPDPVAQQRKTALMQEVNLAYQAQDLLKLLALQLTAEQLQAHKAKPIAAERLAHYQRVLSQQLQQLQAARENLELDLKAAAHLHPSELFSPKRLKQSFKTDVKLLQQQLAALQLLLHELNDPANFKRWLNAYELSAD